MMIPCMLCFVPGMHMNCCHTECTFGKHGQMPLAFLVLPRPEPPPCCPRCFCQARRAALQSRRHATLYPVTYGEREDAASTQHGHAIPPPPDGLRPAKLQSLFKSQSPAVLQRSCKSTAGRTCVQGLGGHKMPTRHTMGFPQNSGKSEPVSQTG